MGLITQLIAGKQKSDLAKQQAEIDAHLAAIHPDSGMSQAARDNSLDVLLGHAGYGGGGGKTGNPVKSMFQHMLGIQRIPGADHPVAAAAQAAAQAQGIPANSVQDSAVEVPPTAQAPAQGTVAANPATPQQLINGSPQSLTGAVQDSSAAGPAPVSSAPPATGVQYTPTTIPATSNPPAQPPQMQDDPSQIGNSGNGGKQGMFAPEVGAMRDAVKKKLQDSSQGYSSEVIRPDGRPSSFKSLSQRLDESQQIADQAFKNQQRTLISTGQIAAAQTLASKKAEEDHKLEYFKSLMAKGFDYSDAVKESGFNFTPPPGSSPTERAAYIRALSAGQVADTRASAVLGAATIRASNPSAAIQNVHLTDQATAEKLGIPVGQLTAQQQLDGRNVAAAATATAKASAKPKATQTIDDGQLQAMVEGKLKYNINPSFGMGQSGNRDRFNALMGQYQMDHPDYGDALASFKAGTANLTALQKSKGLIGAFDDAFQSDVKNAREASDSVDRTSMKKFNSVEQLIQSDWTDNPALAQLAVTTQTVINQYARIVSSMSGVSTDSARAEGTAILNKQMAQGSFSAALDMMLKETNNRTTGIDREIDKQRVALTAKDRRAGNGQSTPTGTTGSIIVVAPDGSKHPFTSQAQADAFKKLAGIK